MKLVQDTLHTAILAFGLAVPAVAQDGFLRAREVMEQTMTCAEFAAMATLDGRISIDEAARLYGVARTASEASVRAEFAESGLADFAETPLGTLLTAAGAEDAIDAATYFGMGEIAQSAQDVVLTAARRDWSQEQSPLSNIATAAIAFYTEDQCASVGLE